MKKIKQTAAVIIFIATVIAGWFYWQQSLLYPSTDDAYLKANVIQISPQVSGRIIELNVTSHQKVNKDQILLKIDSLPYQYALDQAQAGYDMAAKQVGVEAANVVSARSNVLRAEATLVEARNHANRINTLVKKGLTNKDQAEHASTLHRQAEASLNTEKSELEKAIKALGENSIDNAQIRKAAAVLAQAKFDLDNTVITAGHSGILGDVNIRIGNVVRINQPLFPLVEDHEYWIEANFKETDLQRIKLQQPVAITLDMYPGINIMGTIESVSPASGAELADRVRM